MSLYRPWYDQFVSPRPTTTATNVTTLQITGMRATHDLPVTQSFDHWATAFAVAREAAKHAVGRKPKVAKVEDKWHVVYRARPFLINRAA